MSRASEPVLAWLRTMVDKRGLNTAGVAEKCGLPRARVRQVLSGAKDMTVDELLKLTTALEVSPADLGLPVGTELPPEEPAIGAVPALPEEPALGLNPWGDHPEQLFRVGFALGCDFMFLVDTSQLQTSGLPAYVLKDYEKQNLPIKLDAAYHRYNAPRYEPGAITLTLSFDTLYDCRFPWSTVRQFVFFPAQSEPAPEPEKAGERKKPQLRLVD